MANLIIVSDMSEPATIGRGGQSMYVLQWIKGLERLGHSVYFIEILKKNPVGMRETMVQYFHSVFSRWWVPQRTSLILADSLKCLYGLNASRIKKIAQKADGIISLAAPYHKDVCSLLEEIRPRILIEQDPGYTHLWSLESEPENIFGIHDFYYTVGGNIGTSKCSLPTFGIKWNPIWNPVVMDFWPYEGYLNSRKITTVADWRSYGYLEFEGEILGPKSEEFRKFIELPKMIECPIEIALSIESGDPDIELILSNGWLIEDPSLVANPSLYRDYILGSFAEFSCAKGGYVGTRCGWFSDRSACYLASGRPVVLQSTGFEDLLPTGEGLFAVKTPVEAMEAIAAIQKDYAIHSAAARNIAVNYFNSDLIIKKMLDNSGIE